MAAKETIKVAGLSLHAIGFVEALHWVFEAAVKKQASFVCFANVHMTVEAWRQPFFAKQLADASLLLSDGMPLVKAMKWFSGKKQERIAGMDFFPAFLSFAEKQEQSLRIFFLGGTDEVLNAVVQRTKREFINLKVAGSYSPPFGNWSADENRKIIEQISNSGAQVVFVSLGCPKQEQWMATHFHSVNAVMLGVGAAFGVYSGKQSRAPKWMQQMSLEWLYRMFQEPGRLIKRYTYTNIIFIFLLVTQILHKKKRRHCYEQKSR